MKLFTEHGDQVSMRIEPTEITLTMGDGGHQIMRLISMSELFTCEFDLIESHLLQMTKNLRDSGH